MNFHSFALATAAVLTLSAATARAADMSRMAVLLEGRISADDYPPLALREGMQGETRAMITIGAEGHVTDCRVAKSSGHALLDAYTCALLTQRFVFDPARDAQGQAIAVQAVQPISWILPDDLPEADDKEATTAPTGSRF